MRAECTGRLLAQDHAPPIIDGCKCINGLRYAGFFGFNVPKKMREFSYLAGIHFLYISSLDSQESGGHGDALTR